MQIFHALLHEYKKITDFQKCINLIPQKILFGGNHRVDTNLKKKLFQDFELHVFLPFSTVNLNLRQYKGS